MKRWKQAMLFFVFCLILAAPMKVQASEAEIVTEEAPAVFARPEKKPVPVNGGYCWYEKGKKIKSQWRTYKGNKYYFTFSGYACTASVNIDDVVYVFDSKGRLLRPSKPKFYKLNNGYTYYVDKNGHGKMGWFEVNGRLYRGDSKGRLYRNRVYKGITFKKDGSTVVDVSSRLKLKTMEIAKQITNDKMSKSQKLKACWNYLVGGGRFRYRDVSPNIYKSGWQKEFAYNMFLTRAGSCSSFACAFAALAAEVGYNPYIIYGRVPGSRDGASDGMTRHCWVKINGCHYDPEGYFAGWAGYIYGSSYYPMYHTITKTLNFTTY